MTERRRAAREPASDRTTRTLPVIRPVSRPSRGARRSPPTDPLCHIDPITEDRRRIATPAGRRPRCSVLDDGMIAVLPGRSAPAPRAPRFAGHCPDILRIARLRQHYLLIVHEMSRRCRSQCAQCLGRLNANRDDRPPLWSGGNRIRGDSTRDTCVSGAPASSDPHDRVRRVHPIRAPSCAPIAARIATAQQP